MELRVTAGGVHIAIKLSSIVFLVLFAYCTVHRAIWDWPYFIRSKVFEFLCPLVEVVNRDSAVLWWEWLGGRR